MLSAPHLRVDLAVEEGKWAPRNDSALVRDARLWWRDFSRLATWGLAGPIEIRLGGDCQKCYRANLDT